MTELKISISELGADDERLFDLSRSLIRDLRELEIESVKWVTAQDETGGRKGTDLTIGAFVVVILPAILPQLLSLLQYWTSERRRVVIEAPNGAKVEFTPDQRYTEEDILDFMTTLNQLDSNTNDETDAV